MILEPKGEKVTNVGCCVAIAVCQTRLEHMMMAIVRIIVYLVLFQASPAQRDLGFACGRTRSILNWLTIVNILLAFQCDIADLRSPKFIHKDN